VGCGTTTRSPGERKAQHRVRISVWMPWPAIQLCHVLHAELALEVVEARTRCVRTQVEKLRAQDLAPVGHGVGW
jgi:hypothetical protein